MRNSFLSVVLSAALVMALGACVPDPALIEAGLAKPPEPRVMSGVYTSSMDGAFPVPAIPVEKVPTEFQRQTVYYPTAEVPGTIVINPAAKHLYLVTGKNTAIRYGIAVGAAGFQWSGEALITDRKQWPTWTPPKEMIERDPKLAKWENGQPGGPTNPLGARAIYLKSGGIDYGYRIHGTPEWKSIGRNASSGCIRMINQDVIDLYSRLKGGEKVIVLTASGEIPKGLYIPKPVVPAKKAAPAPVVPAGAVPALKILPPPAIATGSTAVVTPAVAPATPAPAVVEAAPPTTCASALVNGVCPPAAAVND